MALDLSDGFGAVANGIQDLDLEVPIFTVEHVQLQFSIAADFVAAQVANNVIILALSNGRILRIDLNRPEDIDGELEARLGARSMRASKTGRTSSFDHLLTVRPQILTSPRSRPKLA